MSVIEVATRDDETKSRKRNAEIAELEINVDAPEPPSKKALRKAKKAKASTGNDSNPPEVAGEKPSSPPNDPRLENKRSQFGIWIGNLSFSTTKDDLLKFLTTHSQTAIRQDLITRVHLPQGPPKFGKSQNKGFAYIDFADEESLTAALTLSEGFLGGRRVLIKNATDFAGRPEQKKESADQPTHPPSKRVFVGNLDFDTTVEDLDRHFGICGSIVHTHMATFEDSGKCKGFAWIEFEQLESAEAAMRGWVGQEDDDDVEEGSTKQKKSSKRKIWVNKLDGRRLRMEYAEDKVTRYQKRFGKNAKTETETSADGGKAGEEGIVEIVGGVIAKQERKTKKSRPQGKYSDETVQRLTGAIVEGKGQKMVFE